MSPECPLDVMVEMERISSISTCRNVPPISAECDVPTGYTGVHRRKVTLTTREKFFSSKCPLMNFRKSYRSWGPSHIPFTSSGVQCTLWVILIPPSLGKVKFFKAYKISRYDYHKGKWTQASTLAHWNLTFRLWSVQMMSSGQWFEKTKGNAKKIWRAFKIKKYFSQTNAKFFFYNACLQIW